MIITRTPLRISIGGGGTDLPSYYEQFGGYVISAAISQYIFVGVNHMFSKGYLLKYSALENPDHVEDIQHPIFREVLKRHHPDGEIEIASLADVPSGTGLGSSGTFTVGLLRALYAFKRQPATPEDLAAEACDLEMNMLGRAIGKQDQYIAAFGGLTCFDFRTDGTVGVKPLAISNDTLLDLEHNMLMFFTGYSRNSIGVLADQKERSLKGDPAMIENLHLTKQLGLATQEALESGKTRCFAELMKQHWEHKRTRSHGMSNEQINRWYDIGMNNGALGGKLVGAGGGGYLLFYAEDPMRVRRALAPEGISELRFRFDHDGSTVLVRD
jgi:D-glycero-alpha-D-manno-heptose-7-phosphate kinase